MSESDRKMGWLRDYADFRDFSPDKAELSVRQRELGQKKPIKEMLNRVGVAEAPRALPASVDLKAWCSPIEDQGKLGSCTANAVVGLVEYFERRAHGRHIDASRLFLYKTTRDLLRWTGDTGAFIRSTMGALVLFGVPPEEYLPYVIPDFDKEPSAFCYAFAQNFQAISYYRLDPPGTKPEDLLSRIKAYLAAGLPSVFGFTVYSSYTQADSSGCFPFPTAGETVVGGHAVDAVGYDDAMKIKNSNPGATDTTGALLIRNSWGPKWGPFGGYAWLPYDYVLKGLAVDWWSLLKNEWVDSGNFKLNRPEAQSR